MWENYWNVCPCFCPQSILSIFIYRGDNLTSEMYIFFKTKLFCFIEDQGFNFFFTKLLSRTISQRQNWRTENINMNDPTVHEKSQIRLK